MTGLTCRTTTWCRPYGGALVQAFVPADERPAVRERLQRLPTLPLSETELHDLELLGSGAYSPLTGFMGRVTYQSVLEQAALPDGLPWGLPVVLSVSADTARGLVIGNDVALARGDQPVGLMRVDEVYPWDPVAEASAVYGQRYAGHPALAGRRAAGRTYLVGGPVALLSARATSWLHPPAPVAARDACSQFARRGWRQVGAIHVCHPWQRVHEYLLRCALEASDGLLLHGAIGGARRHGHRTARGAGRREPVAAGELFSGRPAAGEPDAAAAFQPPPARRFAARDSEPELRLPQPVSADGARRHGGGITRTVQAVARAGNRPRSCRPSGVSGARLPLRGLRWRGYGKILPARCRTPARDSRVRLSTAGCSRASICQRR